VQHLHTMWNKVLARYELLVEKFAPYLYVWAHRANFADAKFIWNVTDRKYKNI